MEIFYAAKFIRRVKKFPVHTRESIRKRIKIFLQDREDARLNVHKLQHRNDEWSFSVSYDLRIIFLFEKPDRIIFVDIGSHDDVY